MLPSAHQKAGHKFTDQRGTHHHPCPREVKVSITWLGALRETWRRSPPQLASVQLREYPSSFVARQLSCLTIPTPETLSVFLTGPGLHSSFPRKLHWLQYKALCKLLASKCGCVHMRHTCQQSSRALSPGSSAFCNGVPSS